ncbi:MAG: RNA polymerase sigma factor [Kofleriaceae bacterium]
MATSTPLHAIPAASRSPLTDRSDEDLMVLAGAGSQAAFAQLVERYLPRVVNYCVKVTGDQRAGEAFLQLWAHRQRYVPSAKFSVFLFTAVRNRCRNYGRWWRRRRPWEDEDASEIDVQSTASQLDELIDREHHRRMREALTKLPPKLREAILLRFDQELDYPEIAAIVGHPEATVRSRVFHGLRQLRSLIQPSIGERS